MSLFPSQRFNVMFLQHNVKCIDADSCFLQEMARVCAAQAIVDIANEVNWMAAPIFIFWQTINLLPSYLQITRQTSL